VKKLLSLILALIITLSCCAVAFPAGDGKNASDHAAAECDFTFIKTEDYTPNTQSLEIIKAFATDLVHRIVWFLTALCKVLSDIGNLPALLEGRF